MEDDKKLDAKEIALLLDNIPTKDSFAELLDGVKGIGTKLETMEDKYSKALEGDVVDDPEAEMGRKGWFDEITSMEVWGVPVGQAVVGGFAAIFASELVDGFMADMKDWQKGLVKLGVAAVAAKWGSRILGSTGSKAVALLLTFDAIRDFTPIDSWADQLAEKISGRATTAGLAGNQSRRTDQPASQGKDSSYYALAMGGGK